VERRELLVGLQHDLAHFARDDVDGLLARESVVLSPPTRSEPSGRKHELARGAPVDRVDGDVRVLVPETQDSVFTRPFVRRAHAPALSYRDDETFHVGSGRESNTSQ